MSEKTQTSEKCKQCEFYNPDADNCKANGTTECSTKDMSQCTDFLVKAKLVHF